MNNHNVNATELIEAILAVENKGWDWKMPILMDYAKQHPTKFIESVENHTDTNICNDMVNVILKDPGKSRIYAIKIVRKMTGLGLAESKYAVESGNFKMYGPNVSEKMTKRQAKQLIDIMKKEWDHYLTIGNFPTFVIVPAK